MAQFEVLRQHFGDKQYWPGDVRDASERDVSHLVKAGVLRAKAAPELKNKAEPSVKNKAAKNAEKG